ncbi:alpha-hydroxy-acid oxidizing protein [Fusibacter sp. JL216-2]|uniref:alpha-hydroxy-acid oxidizing protein n=1 Tax=Fusibacter sp. JL216-2 TaxID=3071453 RepID=UPI003D325D8D
MNYQDVKKEAKKNIGPYCKVCPVCNGIACRGVIPGPGGKGSGQVFVRNYSALQDIKVNMNTLYERGPVDTSADFFGHEVSLPVYAAPVGGVKIHYSDLYDDLTYSQEIIKGCREAGVIGFTGDGADDEVFAGTIEAIKQAEGLGVPTIKPWEMPLILKKLEMANNAGVTAIAMDIDAAGLAFLAQQGKPVGPLSLDMLCEITQATDKPFIVKGVMTAQAAELAIKGGASGIIVSNHGGRVLDETPSSVEVLEDIVKAVNGRIKVFVDGGIRSGIDIFKVLALGADGVLIARPFTIAAYGGGAQGVQAYVNQLRSELENVMLMTGAKSLDEITRDKIWMK